MSLSFRHRSMINAAADLRLVYGPNAAKKIARRFGIAVVTAKLWLSGCAPTAREQEIAGALLAECTRLEELIADTRRRWEGPAHEQNETPRPGDRRGAGRGRSPAHRMGGQLRDWSETTHQ